MVTITIKDLIDNKGNSPNYHWIYLVRNSDDILYIGMSQNPENRLLEHLGNYSLNPCPSSLGQLITANLPDSLDWQIEYLTLKDCEPIVSEYFIKNAGTLADEMIENYHKSAAYNKFQVVSLVERILIGHYRPFLNITYSQSNRLPDKYRKHRPNDSSSLYLP